MYSNWRQDHCQVATSELLTSEEASRDRSRVAPGPATENIPELIVAEAIVTLSRRSRGVRIAQLAMDTVRNAVLGAHRHGELLGPDLSTALLRPADTLLLEGTPEGFARLTEVGDLAAITDAGARAFRRGKRPCSVRSFRGCGARRCRVRRDKRACPRRGRCHPRAPVHRQR